MDFETFKKQIIENAIENGCTKVNPKGEKVLQFMYNTYLETNKAYCPCQPEQNENTICPCIKFKEKDNCCCNLFKKDIF